MNQAVVIPNAPEGFIPYNSPVDFFNNYANGLSALGPPWSWCTAGHATAPALLPN